jgi:hypothetical protein
MIFVSSIISSFNYILIFFFGVSLITLFILVRNAGYKTYLVNKFRISNLCNEEIKKFLEKPSIIAKYIITEIKTLCKIC